ncbi:MAG: UvrD-helicase domain-containing protein, partial [Xanthomonadales bacterium]|nr:UvrD-helicase domain-containing protein [Xanthomonadales bacterium]
MRLNAQQQAAVRWVDGPLLVLAGAGSGKTSVITHKIAHLIGALDYLPEKIAAITFTNKAAREMKGRVSAQLGSDAEGLTVSTFHALGLRFLHAEAPRIGYRPGFSIFDTEDVTKLLKEILPDGLSREGVALAAWRISRWKAEGLLPDEISPGDDSEARAAEAYAEYAERMARFNAFDFDDLILRPARLLERDEEVREKWQQRFRHILVDEYQDTNAIQYRMLNSLLGPRLGLTAVGDDDQSIYGWRGAQPENLAQLARDHPELKVIKLEQNYRSVRNVLKAANALISHNPHDFEKRLWSDLGEGDPIRIVECAGDDDEIEKLVAAIQYRRFTAKNGWRDFAVLYRSNHQARRIEQAFRAHQMPYQLSGGASFFDRVEIKDLLAYVRLLANPRDDGAFLRVINTPRRELGATSVEIVAEQARARGVSSET